MTAPPAGALEANEMTDKTDALLALLKRARDKLDCYYKHTAGEYPGGEPNQTLFPALDKALAQQPAAFTQADMERFGLLVADARESRLKALAPPSANMDVEGLRTIIGDGIGGIRAEALTICNVTDGLAQKCSDRIVDRCDKVSKKLQALAAPAASVGVEAVAVPRNPSQDWLDKVANLLGIDSAEMDNIHAAILSATPQPAASVDVDDAEITRLRERAERLEAALRYAVDNPSFDSATFDSIARAALADGESASA